MPIYLAYQTEPEQWTRERLVRIIDDYFELKEGVRNAEEWIQKAEAVFEEGKETYAGVFHRTGKTLLERVVDYSMDHQVKNHPLLRIFFAYDKKEDFTGLMIKGHGGSSEVFVELTDFKPEMDAFLEIIGIQYEDRSKLKLGE